MKKLALLIVFIVFIQVIPVSANSYTRNNFVAIMYHKLSENPSEWSPWCTSPQNFENDILYLKEKGYVFKTAGEIAQNPPDPNQKTAVLTFDDGYMSDYVYALPILEKHGACATFFVIGSRLNYSDYLTDDTLKLLSQSPRAEIGNHSYYLHLNAYLTIKRLHIKRTPNYVLNDFARNKSHLEKMIGRPVTSLSYPNGVYSANSDRLVHERGLGNITFSTGGEPYVFPTANIVGRRNRGHEDLITDIAK